MAASTVAPIWQRAACDEAAARALADDLGVSPTLARLLVLRGLANAGDAKRFLAPSLDHLHDPLRLADMPAAVDRLLCAVQNHERIAIHGDYDVDGITATVILRRALDLLGAEVVHFIPERIRDGYGLQVTAIERLHAEGVRLIVSVDCGIRSLDAARRARELGVDLIVTDHHEPDSELPRAVAVIDPKRADCSYPDKHLAGVGVVLKVVQALCARANRERWLPAFVKIAAIGTLADVVPLVGENRVIAKCGLDLLSRGPNRVGLRTLVEAAGLAGRAIDGEQVAFILAPRVNAAGRMSTPDIATRLLLASDEAMAGEARLLAEQLNAENLRRQTEERQIVEVARQIIESDPAAASHRVLVVAGEGWHRGVIGIVASKLVEIFHRPTVVLSIDGEEAHGSCRSIQAFDMLSALDRCGSLLMRYGGHRLAAGLTLKAAGIDEFRAAINGWAEQSLAPDDLVPRLLIDAELPFAAITDRLAEEVAALAPFGPGNRRPVFETRGVAIVDGPRRIKDRHLKVALRAQGRTFRAMAWRAGEREGLMAAHRDSLDVAFSLERNTWNGTTFVELSLADFRAPAL